MPPDVAEDLDDDVHVGVWEEVVGPGGGMVDVRRFEEPRGLHDPVGGELVHDEVHEADLIDGEPGAVEVVPESLDRSRPVKPDETADKEPEPAGFLREPRDGGKSVAIVVQIVRNGVRPITGWRRRSDGTEA